MLRALQHGVMSALWIQALLVNTVLIALAQRTSVLTRSGWVHSPCCSIRHPSQGSVHVDWGPLATENPPHCSGIQLEYGRSPEGGQQARGYLKSVTAFKYDSNCHEMRG